MPNIINDDGGAFTIALSTGEEVLVDRADFLKLPEFIKRGRWFINRDHAGRPYVYCNRGQQREGIQSRPACQSASRRKNPNTHAQCAPVARFIVGAAPRTQVRYRNGNRLDLRRANLHQA